MANVLMHQDDVRILRLMLGSDKVPQEFLDEYAICKRLYGAIFSGKPLGPAVMLGMLRRLGLGDADDDAEQPKRPDWRRLLANGIVDAYVKDQNGSVRLAKVVSFGPDQLSLMLRFPELTSLVSVEPFRVALHPDQVTHKTRIPRPAPAPEPVDLPPEPEQPQEPVIPVGAKVWFGAELEEGVVVAVADGQVTLRVEGQDEDVTVPTTAIEQVLDAEGDDAA